MASTVPTTPDRAGVSRHSRPAVASLQRCIRMHRPVQRCRSSSLVTQPDRPGPNRRPTSYVVTHKQKRALVLHDSWQCTRSIVMHSSRHFATACGRRERCLRVMARPSRIVLPATTSRAGESVEMELVRASGRAPAVAGSAAGSARVVVRAPEGVAAEGLVAAPVSGAAATDPAAAAVRAARAAPARAVPAATAVRLGRCRRAGGSGSAADGPDVATSAVSSMLSGASTESTSVCGSPASGESPAAAATAIAVAPPRPPPDQEAWRALASASTRRSESLRCHFRSPITSSGPSAAGSVRVAFTRRTPTTTRARRWPPADHKSQRC